MATYYVVEGGTGTKAQATNPSTPMSVTTHNSSTFAAGDSILFSSAGGSLTTAVTVPSSGTAGNPITYGAKTGESPAFSIAGTNFTINGKNYVTVQDLSFSNSGATGQAMRVQGTNDHLTFQRLTLDAPQYGILGDGTVTNLTVAHIIGTARITIYTLYFYGAGSGPISISDVSLLGGGVALRYYTGITVARLISADASAYSLWLRNCGGACALSSIVSTASLEPSSGALTFEDSAFTAGTVDDCEVRLSATSAVVVRNSSGLTFNRLYVFRPGGAGVRTIGTSSNIVYNDSDCLYSTNDGWLTNDSANTITYNRCRAIGNGDRATTDGGDGFTAHLTNHTIICNHCISAFNTCTGFAMVGTSSGEINNCVVYGNGGDWTYKKGVPQVRGGIYLPVTAVNPTTGKSWTVRNTIGAKNYPCEVFFDTPSGPLVSMDYNCYDETSAAKFATLNAGSTYIDWATYSSREPHSKHADPLLAFPSRGDFRVTKNSPCIGAGLSLVGSETDFAGNAVGSPADIGAYRHTLWDEVNPTAVLRSSRWSLYLPV